MSALQGSDGNRTEARKSHFALVCGIGGIVGALVLGAGARDPSGHLFHGFTVSSAWGLLVIAGVVGAISGCLGGILAGACGVRRSMSIWPTRTVAFAVGLLSGAVLLYTGTWAISETIRWLARR